jgi:hypothetical protein
MHPEDFMETIGWTMLFYAIGCLIGLFLDPDWHPFQDAVFPTSRGTAMTGCVVVIAALVGLVMASWFANWRTPEVETPDVDILHGIGIVVRREWELLKNDLAMEMRRRRRARFPASAQAEALELEREARLDILRDCPDFSLVPPLFPMEQDDVSQNQDPVAPAEHEVTSPPQNINQDAPEEESVDSETSGDEWRRRLISDADSDESDYSPEVLPSDEEQELVDFFEELFAELLLGAPAPPPTEVHAWDWVPGDEFYDGIIYDEPSSHDPSPLSSYHADNLEGLRRNVFISPWVEGGPASPDDNLLSRDDHQLSDEERTQLFTLPNGDFPEGVMLFNVGESPDVEIDEWLASLEENAPAPLVPEPWLPYESIVEEERRRWLISPHDSYAALIDEEESILEDVALFFERAEEMTFGEGKEVVAPDHSELDPEAIFEMDADEFFAQFDGA